MNLLHDFWFIQSIGLVALLFGILTWNAKTRNNIFLLQSVGLLFFTIHYLLLAAYAGAVMCVVTLGRNLIFVNKTKKKWADHRIWFYLVVFVSVFVLFIFWQGWITILPVVGVVVGTSAMSQNRPADIRFYMLITCIIWIPYTLFVHSYSGLLSQIVGILGILIGMYRLDRKSPSIS
ncbi:MAG: YgjV family protein [Patescibacteria group bacterium]|jgi:hypothetical protein